MAAPRTVAAVVGDADVPSSAVESRSPQPDQATAGFLNASPWVLVPPLHFAMVSRGIYRSGFPNRRNHLFLHRLGLRTIVYLSTEAYSEPNRVFLQCHKHIQFLHRPMSGNKELPTAHMDPSTVHRVLETLLMPDAYPVLVHCNQGIHRVGCVMGLLRKLQRWSLTAIFDEYRRFAANKARIADLEFIELTDVSSLQSLADSLFTPPATK